MQYVSSLQLLDRQRLKVKLQIELCYGLIVFVLRLKVFSSGYERPPIPRSIEISPAGQLNSGRMPISQPVSQYI